MRFFFLGILLITGVVSGVAQTFGLRTGGNIAWQTWQQQNVRLTPKKRIGPHIAVSVTSMHLKYLASQIEAGYSVIGHGGYTGVGTFNSVPEDQLAFVTLGFMVKFHPVKKFNIVAGPQFGFFIGNKSKFKNNTGKEDLVISMGAEYYFSDIVGIGGRYHLGLTDLNDDDPNVFIQKSRAIQLSIIFRLPSHQLKDYGF